MEGDQVTTLFVRNNQQSSYRHMFDINLLKLTKSHAQCIRSLTPYVEPTINYCLQELRYEISHTTSNSSNIPNHSHRISVSKHTADFCTLRVNNHRLKVAVIHNSKSTHYEISHRHGIS